MIWKTNLKTLTIALELKSNIYDQTPFQTVTIWAESSHSKGRIYRLQGEQTVMSWAEPFYLQIRSDFENQKNGRLEKSNKKGHNILITMNYMSYRFGKTNTIRNRVLDSSYIVIYLWIIL